MRDLVLFHFLSLDGIAEEPSDWFFDDSPQLFALIGRVIETQDDVLLGRGTYDYWVDYWPTSDVEPFATFINTTPKHVATSTALTGHWDHTVRITGPVVQYVRDLKERTGGDIGIHGSTELARTLVSAGLVDQLRFVIPPTLAGHGKRLFTDDAADDIQQFELADIERTPKGTLFLDYRRPATG
jgi:dihydrofolate reductase